MMGIFSRSNKPKSKEGQVYIRHEVLADGNCGYTAFGIERREAGRLLRDNLTQVYTILKPAVLELLLREEFFQYLQQRGAVTLDTTLQMIITNLEYYAAHPSILSAFINFDVEEGRIDAGWAHPATLQAIAHIQGIAIHIWQLGNDHRLLPHHDVQYARYIPENYTSRLDLLFLNNNHFELIEFSGFGNGISPEANIALYPLVLQRNPILKDLENPQKTLISNTNDNLKRFYAKPLPNTFTLRSIPTGDINKPFIWYRPGLSGFGMNLPFLNKDNLRFIAILNRHRQLDTSPETLTRNAIAAIVEDLDRDSDLWDDIFDGDTGVFRSVFSEKDILQEQPNATIQQIRKIKLDKSIDFYTNKANRHESCRNEPHLSDRFKNQNDCKTFVKSRIKVFKFYIYLRRCAILFRDTSYKQPFINLLAFIRVASRLAKNSNCTWLKKKIHVKEMSEIGENWNSSLHEWLTCDKIEEALLRTAGISQKPGVQPFLSECVWVSQNANGIEEEYFCSEFNWLDLQLLLRTPNKYVIFLSAENTIEHGHGGAINKFETPRTASVGVCKDGEPAFHHELNYLLARSSTIHEFVIAVKNKYNVSFFHDHTLKLLPSTNEKFLVDGTPTNDIPRLRVFQNKLVEPHRFFHQCENEIFAHEQIVHETIKLSTTIKNKNEKDKNTIAYKK